MTTAEPYSGAATEPLRQPGGTPVGGRFATMTRREPDVTLAHLSDEEYNADGSFEYPPIPRSVEQHVAFWQRVKVPDAIIARVRAAYIDRLHEWSLEQYDAWVAAHPQPNGHRGLPEWKAARDAAAARIDDIRPGTIPAVLARPLIRAAQMARYARWLDTQEEYNAVLDTEVDLGEEQPWTVRQTLDFYHLDELPDGAFEDAGSYSGINLALMNQRLTELVEILESADGQG